MRLHLIKEWLEQGIEIDLVVNRRKGPLSHLVPDGTRVFPVAGMHNYLFPIGFYRYLKKRRPTHVLSAPHDLSLMTLLIVKLLGLHVPVVVSVHNHLTSEVMFAKGPNAYKLRAVIWILRRVIHRAHGVIAVSQGVADDLKRHFSLPDGRLHVVYNPVVTAEMRQRLQEPLTDNPVPTDTPWVLYAGRFVPAKGLDILFDAFQRMADTTNAHLVLLGDGPLRRDLIAVAKAVGLAERIHLVGFHSNPLPWIREADVMALPSRHEGLANVLIEALACGTQIVASDCPSGSAEILDSGRYGQLVPVGDVHALAGALLRSLSGEFLVPRVLLTERAQAFTSVRAARAYLDRLTEPRPADQARS